MEIKDIYKDVASVANKVVNKGIDKVKDIANSLDKVAEKAKDKYHALEETLRDIEVKRYSECLTFELTEDKRGYRVVKCNERVYDGKVIVPSTYDGMPVVELGNGAFAHNYRIYDEIVLPDTLEIIWHTALSCLNNLKHIHIPKNVREIGRGAFFANERLQAFTVDKENEHFCTIDGNLFTKDKTELVSYAIGKEDEFYYVPTETLKIRRNAFYRATLKKMVLNDNLLEIGNSAFDSSLIEEINLPPYLKRIDAQAFSGCKSLKGEMVIPATVNVIEHEAFYDTGDLQLSFESPTDFKVEDAYGLHMIKKKKLMKSVLKNAKKANYFLKDKYHQFNWTAVRKSDKKVKE